MKPSPDQPPVEAVPGPTVPADIRKQLLRLTGEGSTTDGAAEQTGLPLLTVWRYLDLLRREGAVHLRASEDGRGAEWWRTRTRRSS